MEIKHRTQDEKREAMARYYCGILKIDPDEMVAHGAPPDKNGLVKMVLLHSPRWKLVLPQVEHFLAMKAAYDYVTNGGT